MIFPTLVKYLKQPVESYPAAWRELPCDKTLIRDYEEALALRESDSKRRERFGAQSSARS